MVEQSVPVGAIVAIATNVVALFHHEASMAGGTEPSKLASALASVPGWVDQRV